MSDDPNKKQSEDAARWVSNSGRNRDSNSEQHDDPAPVAKRPHRLVNEADQDNEQNEQPGQRRAS